MTCRAFKMCFCACSLNNMMMALAQLLTDSCARGSNAVLLMPPLDADPLRESSFWSPNQTCLGALVNGPRGLYCPWELKPGPILSSFADIFDLDFFRRQLVGTCRGGSEEFVVTEPPHGAHVEQIGMKQLGPRWDFSLYSSMFSAIYRGLRPSPRVQELVDVLRRQAELHAGPHWAAIHLPIEKDWWWGSSWCVGRPEEKHSRRCYSPAEVAALTRRARRGATGTVLLYAHDKVPSEKDRWYFQSKRIFTVNATAETAWGPLVCRVNYGNQTFKLALPSTIPYIFRNAAEQFFAAAAPAGFFGNAFSTFSKGIALMRSSGSSRGGSYAYDCAAIEAPYWHTPYRRKNLVPLHPGFELLLPLSRATAQVSGESEFDDHCLNPFVGLEKSHVKHLLSRFDPKKGVLPMTDRPIGQGKAAQEPNKASSRSR